MQLAMLVIASREWWGVASAGIALALLLLLSSYRRGPKGPVRWLCFALKSLALIALAACILNPVWSGQRARPGANLFAVVVDNSRSLQIKDRGETRTRGERLRDLLNPQTTRWQATLEENFELRRYFFDRRLQSTKDFSELQFDGSATAMGTSLRTVGERFKGRPLAGILLLSDGNATDLKAGDTLAGLAPVYPVVLGSSGPARDIGIQQVHITQTDFEDTPVSLQADALAIGCRGESVEAQVLDISGRQVARQLLPVHKENDLLAFRFQLRPEKPGVSFYRILVHAKDDPATSGRESPEATLANNSAVSVVDRGRGPHRILYISGRPNWEFKFLNRAVQEDDQLQLVGLIRVAKREPKFAFKGRAGETSNPLYRGFGNQPADEVEQYDQPVLVRLNTKDQLELRGGFPRTPEDLYGYHAVIVDHLEAEFFKPEEAALLQKFVTERGGGFLMLGGMESFREGNYQRTPIGDMLPVYLEPVPENTSPGPVHLDLTREGWLQSWARLRDNETDEKTRLHAMTPFQVFNRVRGVKPGASVIATASEPDGKTFPALVVQQFGRGRTGALTVGDVWRWGFHDAPAHADMDKAWRQLLRWLVHDVPNRVELGVEPQPAELNGAVKFTVRVRDPKFEPMDNARVSIVVQAAMVSDGTRANTNGIRLEADPSASEPGTYEAAYLPHASGGYLATVCVTNSDGIEVGRAETGWSTDLAAEEFRSLNPNTALLEGIARTTSGEMVEANKLDEFASRIPRKQAPVMESWTYPLWHTPTMFGFALCCLLAEWGLRRWKGMA